MTGRAVAPRILACATLASPVSRSDGSGETRELDSICALAATALNLGSDRSWTLGAVSPFPFSTVQLVEFRAPGQRIAVVVKAFHDRVIQERQTPGGERAERSLEALRHIRQHMPAASGFTAAEPLAVLGRCLAMRKAEGTPVEQLWVSDRRSLVSAYRSLGQWLRQFSMVPIVSAADPREVLAIERERLAANLARIESKGGMSTSQRSAVEGRVDALARAIEARPRDLRVAPCHGDFIPINVFHRNGLTTAIDFETMRPGFWPRDVVSILVDLGLRAALNPFRRAFGRRCSKAFLDGRGVSPAQLGDELFQLYLTRELTAQLVTRSGVPTASLRQRGAALVLKRVVLSLLLEPRRQWGFA